MGNLILTGFMGTGKTSVGREVARQLGRELVDMDAEIEARAGMPITRIFAEQGEAAFRRMESELVEELCSQVADTARPPLVIATGGGTLVDGRNRERMLAHGTVVCLTCPAEEILRRLENSNQRPLLAVGDPQSQIEQLLAARSAAYTAIPWQVETTGRSLEQVAADVLALARVTTLPVHHPGGIYPVHLGDGLLAQAGSALRAAGAPAGSQVALVSNPVVAPLYGDQVQQALRAAGLHPFPCTVPDGEAHKTLATVADLYRQLLAGQLGRDDTVLALGGGVTGDLAGFAAATFMRGVRFAQLPTTLLAMVDASVGGKTGVDLPEGKNLVGAFWQPAMVLVDPAVLATLPAEELRAGAAETIKHGVIGDPVLFAALERGPGPVTDWRPLIERALRVKIEVVQTDPLEAGRRAVLNLGHTVGHALEQLSDFALRHGEAVAIGMMAAAHLAVELGRADRALPGRIEGALAAWAAAGRPMRCPPFPAEAIWGAMAHDKKRRGRALRWVLPEGIGRAVLVDDVPQAAVFSALKQIGVQVS